MMKHYEKPCMIPLGVALEKSMLAASNSNLEFQPDVTVNDFAAGNTHGNEEEDFVVTFE